jgi:hypothetical protein
MSARSGRLFAIVVLVIAGLFLGPAVGTASTPRPATADTGLAQTDIDADSVTLDVEIGPEEPAHWRMIYRKQLETDNETQAFDDLEADIESSPDAYLDPYRDRIGRVLQSAENATDREMTASNFSITAERRSQPQGEFGVVVYRFDWRGFADRNEGSVEVGDALDQLFLNEDERLQFRWSDDFDLETASPTPTLAEDGRVAWQGQRNFGVGEPRATLVTGDGTTDGTAGEDGQAIDGDGSADESGTDGGDSLISQYGLLVVLIVGLLAIAGAYLYRNRDTTAGSPAPVDDTADTMPPADLMSNEERVISTLEANGGRMKQQVLADELDWTGAKTSQVVGDLRDEDKIQAFRIGRENVLTLPDVDITDAGADDGDAGAHTDDESGASPAGDQ